MEPILLMIGAALVITFAVIMFLRSVLYTTVNVPPHTKALLYRDGRKAHEFGAGIHTVYGSKFTWQLVDPRPQWIHVAGQELITADGAPVRVSVSVQYGVSDLDRFAAAANVHGDIYALVQLQLREQVIGRTLEQLVAERAQIDELMRESLDGSVQASGVEINRLAIRDLTLIGDLKRAYADVINAQLRSKAALERARGEAAAMRSLLNTAELVRQNPELIHLRALQGMEQGQAKIEFHLGDKRGEA